MAFINQKEWDVETTTAGDYSVEMSITPSMLAYFRDHNEFPGQPFGFALKMQLSKDLPKLLAEVPSMGFDDNLLAFNVVDIHFCFDNGKLIKKLIKRGTCIKNNDWKGLKEINETLDATKNQYFQKIQTPVSCFITMEDEESYQRALSINAKGLQVYVLGEIPTIIEAPEPTNVIWENRAIT